MVPITGIYIAICSGIFLWLSARVIVYRRQNKISLGDEGDKGLLKRMRAQGNCAEYVPIGMLLMAGIELNGGPALVLHLIGLTFVAGRIMHAYGFSTRPPNMKLRVYGMILTLTSIGFAITVLVVTSIL